MERASNGSLARRVHRLTPSHAGEPEMRTGVDVVQAVSPLCGVDRLIDQLDRLHQFHFKAVLHATFKSQPEASRAVDVMALVDMTFES